MSIDNQEAHGHREHDQHGHDVHGASTATETQDTTRHESGDRHGHDSQGGHDKHAGHSVAMFRDRFWLSLALSLPVVFYSEMIQEWFGYTAPSFPGSQWISPVLGTVIFFYGGSPFLKGAVQEARDRQPGMILLIGMAITVAFLASAATTLGWFGLDFWWEPAALITIMLLGHWMEMRAIGQAGERLPLSPNSCRTKRRGSPTTEPKPYLLPIYRSMMSSWSGQVGASPPTGRSSAAKSRSTSRWSPASPSRSPRVPATRSWPEPSPLTTRSERGSPL